MSDQRVAAIDIGTVTCRLLVADVVDGEVQELCRRCEITNLGEGVDANGYLLDSAMNRVDAQIQQYVQIIESYSSDEHPVSVVAMATSASRDASNSADFIAMLEKRGIHLSVIPGEKEATLSFMGASSGFAGQHLLVADVGGGSTELIFGVGGEAPLFKHSFNVGCRRVTERFLVSDPYSPSEMQAAIDWFQPQFAEFFQMIEKEGFTIDRVVAVAGTATSMASIDKEMEEYDSSSVHGLIITAERLSQIGDRLAAMTLEERCHVAGLQPGRAPVIVAGTLILGELLSQAHAGSFTVSEHDILHGIVMDAAN